MMQILIDAIRRNRWEMLEWIESRIDKDMIAAAAKLKGPVEIFMLYTIVGCGSHSLTLDNHHLLYPS